MQLAPHAIAATETLQLGQPQAAHEPTDHDARLRHRWRKSPYVPWGLEPPYENSYPVKIEELYLRSSYFRRISDDKAEQIRGSGLSLAGPEATSLRRYFDELGLGDAVLETAAYDLALFNGFALQLIWNRARTRVVRVAPQKISRVRVARPDASGQVTAYYLSSDWRAVNRHGKPRLSRLEDHAPLRLPAYDPERPAPRQLLFAAKYSPVTDYYPLPEAESVYEELSLGADVVGFQRRYVQNGMVSSAMVYVPFVPEESAPGQELTEADRNRMEAKRKQIVEDLTGKMKAGQLSIIWFNPYLTDKDGRPTGVPRIEKPVEEKNDAKFIEVQQESRQSFLTGLGVVAQELYGIPSAGGFSSQSEMLLTANELTYNKLIRPKQNVLLEALRRLARDAGFRRVEIGIHNPLPVSYRLTPEMVRAGIFTADEFRSAYGYEPLRSPSETLDT